MLHNRTQCLGISNASSPVSFLLSLSRFELGTAYGMFLGILFFTASVAKVFGIIRKLLYHDKVSWLCNMHHYDSCVTGIAWFNSWNPPWPPNAAAPLVEQSPLTHGIMSALSGSNSPYTEQTHAGRTTTVASSSVMSSVVYQSMSLRHSKDPWRFWIDYSFNPTWQPRRLIPCRSVWAVHKGCVVGTSD